MKGGDFLMADVTEVDLKNQSVTYRVIGQDTTDSIHYDHLLIAVGSVTRMLPIPGLKEYAFEIKSLSDAVELRDRGIRLLELANTMSDKTQQRNLLRHVVVGANFTGIEFAGEYQAFLMDAVRDYHRLDPEDVEVIILEHGDRILNAVSDDLADWAERTLIQRGVRLLKKISVQEIGEDYALLTDGTRLGTHSVIWAAGVAPNPLLGRIAGLPLNSKGYIDCEQDLRVKGFENVWAVGDSATVLADNGKPYAATAQTASRQGPLAAKNIVRTIKGEPTSPFKYHPLGSFAAIGHRRAAADFLGKNIKGVLGWVLYRGTYLMKMPTLAMKMRLGMDWLLELILPSESVQVGVHRPRSADARMAEQSEHPPSESVR
jgi:NADH dehydrogenase